MIIKILGNGGFLNEGIPYNSVMINGTFLIEVPPDIMTSLNNQGIRFYDIERIYISHFHGDHYFGLPFLILNLFSYYLETKKPLRQIEIVGPPRLRESLVEIQKIAISHDNPSIGFIDEVFRFVEIDAASRVRIDEQTEMIFHQMNHGAKLTYGFSLLEKGSYKITYLCDTKWSDGFLSILDKKPRLVLCDLNSRPDGQIKEHMTEVDIIQKAFPVTGNDTRYVGIHLFGDRMEDRGMLQYSKVGDEFCV